MKRKMKVVVNFEEREVVVADNTCGLTNVWKCEIIKKKYGAKLKDYLCLHRFLKAFLCDFSNKKEFEKYFSTKVAKVLNKIMDEQKIDSLSRSQVVLLFCDFIFPIVYEETGINKFSDERFMHKWIIDSCKFIWNDIPENIKVSIYNVCGEDAYIAKELSEEEKICYELEKYPNLVFRFSMDNMEESFIDFLQHKGRVPNHLYAYLVRQNYCMNTYGISEKTLHAVFDGLSKEDLMSSDEIAQYLQFPDKITIYRGTDSKEVIPRLSWTLDRTVAKRFSSGGLFTATISKERIIAFFDTIEQEVLVWLDPMEVKRIY